MIEPAVLGDVPPAATEDTRRYSRLQSAIGGVRAPAGARRASPPLARSPLSPLEVPLRFSDNVSSLEPSATLALAARARKLREEGRSVVDLSAGEPTFGTPEYAAEAGVRAIREGRTGYPPTAGIPELRDAARRYLRETTDHPDPDAEILVGAGVKQALHNCITCLFGDGDEVLVPAPYWPTYPVLVRLAGAEPVVVETRWEDGFEPTMEALAEARSDRTRGLLLNSPGNPTGAVYGRKRLAQILEWAGRHELWVLSDEIYRRLHYGDGAAPSVYDLADRSDRVVLLDGVSKAFCMTGWRIGFASGPAELVAKATDYQSQTTSGAVTPAQYAAAAALGRSDRREAAIETLLEKLRATRRIGIESLEGLPSLEVRPPEGAIYFYARLDTEDSMEVAERLLKDSGVACIPGEPFGSPGYLRFNFAVDERTMSEGMDRVRAFFGA